MADAKSDLLLTFSSEIARSTPANLHRLLPGYLAKCLLADDAATFELREALDEMRNERGVTVFAHGKRGLRVKAPLAKHRMLWTAMVISDLYPKFRFDFIFQS